MIFLCIIIWFVVINNIGMFVLCSNLVFLSFDRIVFVFVCVNFIMRFFVVGVWIVFLLMLVVIILKLVYFMLCRMVCWFWDCEFKMMCVVVGEEVMVCLFFFCYNNGMCFKFF